MKSKKPRISSKTLELDKGFYAIRFVSAAVPGEAVVTVAPMPGHSVNVQMLGDMEAGAGQLRTPGSMLVVRATDAVQLLVTILTSFDVLKANVQIAVESLESKPEEAATDEGVKAPRDAVVPDTRPSEPTKAAATAPWFKWQDKPNHIILSMSTQDKLGSWTIPRPTDDIDLSALGEPAGFRWAIVGPGRQAWHLRAEAIYQSGRKTQVEGQNLTLLTQDQDSIAGANLFVRSLVGGAETQILMWNRA